MREPTIFAMGGGGFSMEPDNPLLDDYVLGLTGKERPSVCFVPTASGDAEGYVERFHAAFTERAETAVLQLVAAWRLRSESGEQLAVQRLEPLHLGAMDQQASESEAT